MASPQFIAATHAWSDPATSVTSGSIAFPPQTRAGDLAVLRIDARSTIAIPFANLQLTQAGWQTQQGTPSLPGGAALLLTKTLTSSDLSQPISWSLTGVGDAMRWGAVLLIFRAMDAVQVLVSDQAFVTNDGTAPSVSPSDSGLRLAFWVTRIDASYIDDGWTAPPGVAVLHRAVNPSTSPGGGVKYSALVTSDTVPAGATGTLTAVQANGISVGGTVLWERRFTVVIEGKPITTDRVRSNVSEDAGSIFMVTQAVAVEMSIAEAFDYGEDVPAGVLRAFSEALTPDEAALRYYPLPTRNQEMLVTVEGETNLGRMAHTVPAAIMRAANDIPGNVGGLVTAQQAIQAVVDEWSAQHTWLQFEPIPDLRFVVGDALGDPRQYYLDHPDAGVLTIAAVTIPQGNDGNQNERRTMREILDEWLAVFTGTIVRQNSAGRIELVPLVGPDAPDGPALSLAWRDLLALSDGEDDPSGVINRARVTSQAWEWADETPLIAPSFVVILADMGIQRSVLEAEEVLPDGTRQEVQPDAIATFTDVLADDAPVTVDVEIYAYGSWSRTSASAFRLEGQQTRQVTLARGASAVVSITHNSRSQNVTQRFRLERFAAPNPDGIVVTPDGGIAASATNIFGTTYFAYVVDVDVEGVGWVRTNQAISSEFGQATDSIPAEGGGNAITNSRATYGERLATINSSVFQLTNEQAYDIARSYVLWNINPRTIREVQQSEWDRYPVKFDHIGRYIDLPNGERAVVENRDYSDSFAPLSGTMQSSFTAAVTEVVIDTSTPWLYLDNGDFFQLDSGELVEAS